MALYDAGIDKVVVRIVYDGPGTAGKTTNLQRLAALHAADRRSELTTPEEKVGRTTYFDWLHLEGGLVAGRPLRAELVTVPGQRVLARRRFALLDEADAIVFVVDCRPSQLADSRQMFASLRTHLEKTGRDRLVPLVLQANKQDVEGATTLDRIREELLIEPHLPLVSTEAMNDVGVRETLVFALRAASRAVNQHVEEHGLLSLSGTAGRPEDLKNRLDEMERNQPMSPLALLLGDWTPTKNMTVMETSTSRPHAASPAAPTEAPTTEAPTTETTAATRTPSSRRPARVHPSDTDWPLPTADVESGWIWPPTSGRAILRKIPFAKAERVVDPAWSASSIVFRAGEHFSISHERRRFSDAESARGALVALAREKSQLGSLLPEEAVLSLAALAEDSFVLWSTTRAFESLPSALERALRAADLVEARSLVRRCADVVIQVAILALRGGLILDLDLEHFALEGERVRHFGDGLGSPEDVPHWGCLWLEGIEPWSGEPELVEAWIDELERRLANELDLTERRQLGLEASLDAASVPPELESTRERILLALSR